MPGQKSVVTGVSLPPDLHAWLLARAKRPGSDPTMTSSASRVVQQALMEYRERIEAEERAMALRAAETPEDVKPDDPKKKSDLGKYPTAEVERRRARRNSDAGAGIISPSASSDTSCSTDGKARFRRAG